MEENTKNGYAEQMLGYIMKHCLWQFHSRTWDRERQNREIMAMTTELLCGRDESAVPKDRLDRCYWVDAVLLARNYRTRFSWLADLDNLEIIELMQLVRERLDFQTITGSLNVELTDHQY